MVLKVFDEHNILINLFPTITSTKYYDVDHNTLSKYIHQGYSLNNLRFEGELIDLRVWVLDKEGNIMNEFSTTNKAANFCGIYHTILHRYLKSGKL